MWASLQRLGAREPHLEDLLQEVFVVVHRRLHTFDEGLPMRAWLFGICRHVVAAHRRKAYVRRERAGDVPEVADPAIDPEQRVSEQEAQAELDALLEGLDLDKRAVIVMFEIDGLPCDTIAATLGIPLGTVYSRLHAARKEFRRAFERRAKKGRP